MFRVQAPRTSGFPATSVSLCILGAFGVLCWVGLETTSARMSAATDTTSTFSSGTIDLDLVDHRQRILFDTENLHPGRVEGGCVELRYDGSVPGTITAFATPLASTGLESYLELMLATSDDCGQEPTAVLFRGTLAEFFARHDRYHTGVVAAARTDGEHPLALHGTATLVDDNAAQGRAVDFSLVVEVRPAAHP